ncbi:MAG: YvcK family protein [Candidatus Pacebacteria bacterium]|nr:YvcK family protein [Candidatus Paceibacterota bacterium]
MFSNPFVKKKIVCIGGGNAMPKAVLRGLKYGNTELTVVSCVLDSGGSSGKLRKEFDIISPGDVRRAFLELCVFSEENKKILDFRFPKGELAEHNLGNLFFAAEYLKEKSYRPVFEKMNSLLLGTHRILPSTIHKADLIAVLENGQRIIGEMNIDSPQHDTNLKIKEIYLEPEVHACPQTVRRIKEAYMVVIGPGDIYSSLMQVLLVKGTAETIKESKAKKVYVCNVMTKKGESNGFHVIDFVKEVEKCLGCELDYIIYNNKIPDRDRIDAYKQEHPELLEIVGFDGLPENKKYIGADLLFDEGSIAHDSSKLAKILLKI